MESEREQLAAALPGQRKELEAVQADAKALRDVRHWLNQVLPPEQYRQTAEPGKKPSIREDLKGGRNASGRSRKGNSRRAGHRNNRIWNFKQAPVLWFEIAQAPFLLDKNLLATRGKISATLQGLSGGNAY